MRIAILILTVSVLLSPASLANRRQGGLFSRSATPIWDEIWERKTMRISAPDGQKTILAEAEGDNLSLRVSAYGKWFPVDLGEWIVGAEAAWSPDSKAFFVTASEGGRVGQYHSLIFQVSEDGIRTVDLNPVVEQAFGHPAVCAWPELPNVVAITWLGSSSRLLLAAQILPHSVCDSMGTFRAYEISVPQGAILRKYSQIETKRLFGGHL